MGIYRCLKMLKEHRVRGISQVEPNNEFSVESRGRQAYENFRMTFNNLKSMIIDDHYSRIRGSYSENLEEPSIVTRPS